MLEIGRYAGIPPALGAIVLQRVGVTQHRPSFAEASEGILLRGNGWINPAKRGARSRMAERVGFAPETLKAAEMLGF